MKELEQNWKEKEQNDDAKKEIAEGLITYRSWARLDFQGDLGLQEVSKVRCKTKTWAALRNFLN